MSHRRYLASALLALLSCLFAPAAFAQESAAPVAEEPPVWMEWRTEKIPVGNEHDGFMDTIEVRRTITNPASGDGVAAMPYLSQVPGEKRLLLMVTRGKPMKCKIMESTDEGETWSEPLTPGGVDWLSTCWGLVCCGNGVIFMDDGAYRSTDNGKTWEWRGLNPDPRFGKVLVGWDPPFVFPGSDGKHILDTAYDNRHFEAQENKVTPLYRESFDAGATWNEWRAFTEFPGASEVHIIANAKGELVAAMRRDPLPAPADDQASRLEYSYSTDGGKTWAPPKVVAGNGRHHPSMAVLPDGRIAMSYVVRTGYPDTDGKYTYGIEAVVSHDGGHTWDTAHRYLLARWTQDCLVKDIKSDRMVHVQKFYGAPQSTSTVYLPESNTLLTAYGTAENIALKDGGYVWPRQVAMVRWMPLDTYSAEKAPLPPPTPAKAMLKRLRNNSYWSVNYNARMGLPDAGWKNDYPQGPVSIVHKGNNAWLRMDHRGSVGGTYNMRGVDHLERICGPVGLRMRLNIDPEAEEGKSERLTLVGNVGSGSDKYAIVLFFDPNANLCGGTFGTVELPTQAGTPFLLEAYFEPVSRTARLWIDGELVKEAEIVPGSTAPEQPTVFWFGYGTPRVGGIVELAALQFGEVK